MTCKLLLVKEWQWSQEQVIEQIGQLRQQQDSLRRQEMTFRYVIGLHIVLDWLAWSLYPGHCSQWRILPGLPLPPYFSED
jgi:hypothetical protein